MNALYKILGLFLVMFYSGLIFGKSNAEKEAQKIVQAYEVDMWKATIAFLLNIDEKDLKKIDKRGEIGSFLEDFECLEEKCFKPQLVRLFSKSEAINVFRQIHPKKNKNSLKGLVFNITEYFQIQSLSTKLDSIYQDAESNLVLNFFNGKDENIKQNLILSYLEGNRYFAQLKKADDWVEKEGLNCSNNPFDCEVCCWLLKKVVPKKLEAINYNSVDNWTALQNSLIEVQEKTGTEISKGNLSKILGSFPVASIECLELFEELISSIPAIDFDKKACTKHLGNEDRQALIGARSAYYQYLKEKNKEALWANFEKKFSRLSFADKMEIESFKIQPGVPIWTKINPTLRYVFIILPIVLFVTWLTWLITRRLNTSVSPPQNQTVTNGYSYAHNNGTLTSDSSQTTGSINSKESKKGTYFWSSSSKEKEETDYSKNYKDQFSNGKKIQKNEYDEKTDTSSKKNDMKFSESGGRPANHSQEERRLSTGYSSFRSAREQRKDLSYNRDKHKEQYPFNNQKALGHRNPVKVLYAARPDGTNGFVKDNLTERIEHQLPYKIEVLDDTTARYELSTDRSIQKQAADSAYYVLQDACDYNGTLPEQMRTGIENVDYGLLRFNGYDEWEIQKKLKIRFF